MKRIEGLKWWIASQLNRLRSQCWADLVSWVLDTRHGGTDLRGRLPWRPISGMCRRDAEECGRCYCGKLASDGTVLRWSESVCVTHMPGRQNDRLCSRPDGHDGLHRCGGVEWGRA